MTASTQDRSAELQGELFRLIDDERQLQREIGRLVLQNRPVDGLRVRRARIRERVEDLTLARLVLDAERE